VVSKQLAVALLLEVLVEEPVTAERSFEEGEGEARDSRDFELRPGVLVQLCAKVVKLCNSPGGLWSGSLIAREAGIVLSAYAKQDVLELEVCWWREGVLGHLCGKSVEVRSSWILWPSRDRGCEEGKSHDGRGEAGKEHCGVVRVERLVWSGRIWR